MFICGRLGFLLLKNRLLTFSVLTVLAIIVGPLITVSPVYADWGADTRLTNNAGDSRYPSVAVSGNVVHVVWDDNRDGNYEIYYKRSTDGGLTWGADTRLTSDAGYSRYPSVAVSGNVVHVVWDDNRDGNYEIYYKRSTDGGVSWGADTRLTNNAGNSILPSIAVSGNGVQIAWQDNRDGNWEIYLKRSADGGLSWGTDTRLTNSAAYLGNPSVAMSGNSVHVFWEDARDGNQGIYYKRSVDSGLSWGADTRITNPPGSSDYPSSVVSGNNVHVAWHDNRDGNWEIYYKRSADGGATWGADIRLTNDARISQYPSLAMSGNNVHVAWQDKRDDDWEIYYNLSTNGGVNWGTDTRLTIAAGVSQYPSLATSGNNVHVAWQDNRDGNWEIYYKKFSVPPAVALVNPPSGWQGQTINVIITGVNLTGATAVNFGPGITVNGFTVDSDGQVTASITIALNAVLGGRDVTVTTAQGTAVLPLGFTVTRSLIGTGAAAPHGSSQVSIASNPPVSLPSVKVVSAGLSTASVASGTPVTVTADVVNSGTINGAKAVTLYVNGQVELTKGIAVAAGESAQLNFQVTRSEPGEYRVYVDGTPAGSFRVEAFTPDTVLFISGALILLAFVLGIIFIVQLRQRR